MHHNFLKPFYLLAFFLFLSVFSFAQNKVAIKAGPTFGNAYARFYSVKQPTSYGVGFNTAIQFTAPFEPPLFFTGMAAISQKSYSVLPLADSVSKYEYRINYISFSPMFTFKLPSRNEKHFAVSAGPMGSLAISGKEKVTVNNITSNRKMLFSTGDNYSLIDLAIYSGIGFHTPKFFVEGNFEYGFVNINHEKETDGRDIQNRTFSLNLGYYLR